MSDKWSEWIEWDGGECPVAPTTQVEVKYYDPGDGKIESENGEAQAFNWHAKEARIFAYRCQIPAESCIAEPDEEAGLQEAYERMNKPKQEYSAYFKDVRHIDTLDVYRVVSLFDCEKHGHAISHAAKKLLLTGARTGGKDVETEVREAIDSLHRWLEMREEDSRAL